VHWRIHQKEEEISSILTQEMKGISNLGCTEEGEQSINGKRRT
jgi:Uri superfamily endonuclease